MGSFCKECPRCSKRSASNPTNKLRSATNDPRRHALRREGPNFPGTRSASMGRTKPNPKAVTLWSVGIAANSTDKQWNRSPKVQNCSAVQTSAARENVLHHHLLSSAPEDIETSNNLLRVLSPKQGYNLGFGAISRPDSLTGFMLQGRSAFVPRRVG